MRKLRVATIVGTRPEIIRLSRVMSLLDQETEHVIIHTGQNYDYELNEVFFKDLELRSPDHFLSAAGATAMETVGNTIARSDEILAKVQSDAVLILGDTNSCLAAYAAKRRKIPVFHMEAGNRCFDQRVPEEINRRIVDHISDINMPYSQIGREYLLREGISPDRVIVTGSPMFEVLNHYRQKIDSSDVIERLGLEAGKFFVVSLHREENIDLGHFSKLTDSLNAVADKYGYRLIFSAHPRTRKRIEQEGVVLNSLIEPMSPLGFSDYVHLQSRSFGVLSDSGTITEESSILNFPAVNMREAHERPEGMEEGSVMLAGFDVDNVLRCIDIATRQGRGETRTLNLVSDYSKPNVSEKVVRIIHSYAHYIRRTVWSM